MTCGFQTYVMYVYLKRHFSDFKFIWDPNSKYARLKEDAFEKRNDKLFFQKLEKSFQTRDDRKEYLISAFLFNNDIWIGDVFHDVVVQFHKDRMKRVTSLESLFQRDAEKIEFYLVDKGITLQDIILTSSSNSPILVQDVKAIGVSFETLAIINQFTSFTDLWFPLNPLLKIRRLQLHKYTCLLNSSEKNSTVFNSLNMINTV